MANLQTVEAKAFVPARDFTLSKSFYLNVGFKMPWADEQLAYFHHGSSAFPLQNFYVADHADNFMMHLLVQDVNAWWDHVVSKGIATKYGVHTEPPEDRPWHMRDFVLVDPSGVLWRVAQNLKR